MTDAELSMAEPERAEPEGSAAPARSRRSETVDFIKFLVKLALAVFIFRSFFLSPFYIPSESMQPRLLIGDYLFVAKWPYGYSRYSLPWSVPLIPGRIFAHQPERGDVVVFKAPPLNQEDYIKRVIGLPGDTVQVRRGITYLNGAPLKRDRVADALVPVTPNMIDAARKEQESSPCFAVEFETVVNGQPMCRYPRFRETLPGGRSYEIQDLVQNGPGDDTQQFVVPAGHVFLMGDNRDRSADSRFPASPGGAIGIVPQRNLVGRALVTIFSTDGSANYFLPWTWFTAARWDRIGKGF